MSFYHTQYCWQAYNHRDYYDLPISSTTSQRFPPAQDLQYLSPPLLAHPSPSFPYQPFPSTTSRHSAQSRTDPIHAYSQPSPWTGPLTSYHRAVIMGINYFNQKGELTQSCREARRIFNYLTQNKICRIEDTVLLTDDQNGVYGQPTRKNVLDALSWIGEEGKQGEKVVIYYSGHGRVATQGTGGSHSSRSRDSWKAKDDVKGLEEGEAIYPVDFRSFPKGMITQDEFHERLRPAMKRGMKLTLILDAHAAVVQ